MGSQTKFPNLNWMMMIQVYHKPVHKSMQKGE